MDILFRALEGRRIKGRDSIGDVTHTLRAQFPLADHLLVREINYQEAISRKMAFSLAEPVSGRR